MWKHVRNTALLAIVVLAFAAWYFTRPDIATLPLSATEGPKPQLSELTIERFPTVDIAEASQWTADGRPVPAAGLTVTRFAEKLDHPRSMLLLPNGDLLVAETNSPPRQNKGVEGWFMKIFLDKAGAGAPSPNRIVLLRDADKDGRAEAKFTLLEGLNSPFGMTLVGEKLYVADTDVVWEYPYIVGETRIVTKARRVANLNAKAPNNHWTRNLIASADGKYLYVAVGSNSNIGEHGLDTEKERANVLEIDLATNRKRIYAAGMRNPVGLAWNPKSGALWTTVNERDMLGSDMVPDYLAQVEFGAHYGWPWHYWGGYTDPRVKPKNEDHREYERRPDYALGVHVAPLGLAFVPDSSSIGARFAGGAVIARHGSWNRTPKAGYDVVWVGFDQRDLPVNKPVTLLSGFLDKDGNAQGRPTMVTFDQTGALLVSDDVGGVIWRVTGTPTL
ncbi:MAG: sorbosone dehydrogenase family protein [Parasphingorhabdus sp.]|nr:sorbosone dehydrogenase family protein [Parasphingorhabdus sp.]